MVSSDTPVPTVDAKAHALYAITGANVVSPLTLVFVRHGVTDMTVTHALSGSSRPGPSLNPEGRIQAAKAADAAYRIGRDRWERVPRISRIIASPMVRTQETAAAIGRRIGISVETDDRLKEINFGEWEGLRGLDIAEQSGDAIHRWRFGEIPAPGGESIPQVGARVDGLVREIARDHVTRCVGGDDEHRTIALASHAVAIKSIFGLSLRMDTRAWGSIWPQPASASIMELRMNGDGEIVERHVMCLGESVE